MGRQLSPCGVLKTACETGNGCSCRRQWALQFVRKLTKVRYFVCFASCVGALTNRTIGVCIGVRYSAQQITSVTKRQPIKSASVRCNNPPELSGKSCPLFLPFLSYQAPFYSFQTFTQSFFTTVPQSICLSLLLAISVARLGLSRVEKTGYVVD